MDKLSRQLISCFDVRSPTVDTAKQIFVECIVNHVDQQLCEGKSLSSASAVPQRASKPAAFPQILRGLRPLFPWEEKQCEHAIVALEGDSAPWLLQCPCVRLSKPGLAPLLWHRLPYLHVPMSNSALFYASHRRQRRLSSRLRRHSTLDIASVGSRHGAPSIFSLVFVFFINSYIFSRKNRYKNTQSRKRVTAEHHLEAL